MTPEQVLHTVTVDIEDGELQDIIVVGYDSEGDLYIRSSAMTCAEAFFMLTKATQWAGNGGKL